MNSDITRQIPSRVSPAALVVLLAACGCGGRDYSPEAHRVDPALARETLESVLKSWQQGETPESWQERDPDVVVQDMDWARGKQLQEFEVLGDGEAIDANLHCEVRLTIADPESGTVEQTVTYLVTTSPKLTVFRKVM